MNYSKTWADPNEYLIVNNQPSNQKLKRNKASPDILFHSSSTSNDTNNKRKSQQEIFFK